MPTRTVVDAKAILNRIRQHGHKSGMQTEGAMSTHTQADQLAAKSRQVKYGTNEDLAIAIVRLQQMIEAWLVENGGLQLGPKGGLTCQTGKSEQPQHQLQCTVCKHVFVKTHAFSCEWSMLCLCCHLDAVLMFMHSGSASLSTAWLQAIDCHAVQRDPVMTAMVRHYRKVLFFSQWEKHSVQSVKSFYQRQSTQEKAIHCALPLVEALHLLPGDMITCALPCKVHKREDTATTVRLSLSCIGHRCSLPNMLTQLCR